MKKTDFSEEIEEIAEFIHKKKLEVPAIVFLEINKPLCLFYSSLFLVSTPILGAFLGAERMKKLYEIMEKRENIEKLIKRIEEIAEDKQQ
ncbi:MAG: hypothetical protein KBT47_06455 [Armatimonadetes bacterium]|nr:hypothetical protein [Candidatus Hippobium faecium]